MLHLVAYWDNSCGCFYILLDFLPRHFKFIYPTCQGVKRKHISPANVNGIAHVTSLLGSVCEMSTFGV